jgi:hypothetical protein
MDKLSKIMNNPFKVLKYLLLFSAGLIVLFYGVLILSFFVSDRASYHGNEVNVGLIDYNSVVSKAEKAGYDVSGPYSRLENVNLIEPGHVEILEKRFKRDYKVLRIVLYYNKDTSLEFAKDDNNRTIVALSNLSHVDTPGNFTSLQPSELPDDSWMLKMFGLSLGLDENGSQEFLERLKTETTKQQSTASLSTYESVDFPTIYTYLNKSSTKTVIKSGMWNEEEFYVDDTEIGYVSFVIPQTTISTSRNFNKYSVDVSSSGFIRADILMNLGSAGKEIPEEEYRTVFKEMFGNLGLPADKVDEIKFEYSPSVW